MYWLDKPYHSLHYDLQSTFHKKMCKLSIDAGFTCPNRDGTISINGCSFCSQYGSGDFTGDFRSPLPKSSIAEQLEAQKKIMSKKWPNAGYIAYFQSFTNTYAPVATLSQKYNEALNTPGIEGIAIATRPDCLPAAVLSLLSDLNQKTSLCIELGFQTSNESTARLFNRGYNNEVFLTAVKNLHALHIPVVAHVILGLPHETISQMYETISFLSVLPLQGIKIHMLQVLSKTPLGEQYIKTPFPLLSKEAYIEIVSHCIALLPPQFVIHRITGDGDAKQLIAPLWSIKKRELLNAIHNHMKQKNIWQGKYSVTNKI